MSLAAKFTHKTRTVRAGSGHRTHASFNISCTSAASATLASECNPEDPGGTAFRSRGAIEIPVPGRYQVDNELGRGAMGIVYLAHDRETGQAVAIKTMALAREFDAAGLTEARNRFFCEAETIGRLTHPNIVALHHAGEERGLAYIAMEFLPGGVLVPWTRREGLLALPQALSIVARVADALAYAHEHGVVHGDIKPANIMYDPASDTVKVTDFGIARIADTVCGRMDAVAGTPLYLSPEQLAGQGAGRSADIFSLGVTLYQLVSGELPFPAESRAQLMFKIAREPHADIRVWQPALPGCVIAIIDKALAKNPDERYRSAGMMAKALRMCLGMLSAAESRG